MATTATRPHPIFLAGRWVESDDTLEVSNPAKPNEPAGATYNASAEQYEEAVLAAISRMEMDRFPVSVSWQGSLLECCAPIRSALAEMLSSDLLPL